MYLARNEKDESTLKQQEYIVWIDVEANGTISEQDKILEIGAIITTMSGEVVSNTYTSLFNVANLSQVITESCEDVRKMHEDSGLWLDLWKNGTQSAEIIDTEMIHWMERFIPVEDSILYFGGNSITLDRNFVRMNLPNVYSKISYRSIDVTSLSLAIQGNFAVKRYEKSSGHRALDDAIDSMEEYKYYLNCISQI